MHCQLYDGEEEFEPRVVPKPITKHDVSCFFKLSNVYFVYRVSTTLKNIAKIFMLNLQYFVTPTVPEISLIFEKPTVRNPNYGSADSSPARSTRLVQISDNTMEITNPISCKPNSYAAWKEQNSREISSTMRVSPLCNNIYNHALPSNLQNASVQKRQANSNDKQEIQNVNKNDRMYEKSVKFKCSNTEDSYAHENQASLSEKEHSSSEKRHSSSNSLLKTRFSVIDQTVGMSSDTISDTLKKSEHFQTPHSGYQQFRVPTYSNFNVDNKETVKTLLQLVNSQNEQIKNLQLQIDRLIRLQEENFRNKSICLCSQPLTNQVFRYPINYYDTTFASSLAQSQNRSIKKNVASQNTSVVEKQDLKNFGENNNKLETALLEQQSTKTFMEQKVSIGVMTSFELTVQNSPFLIDSEICEKKEAHRKSNIKTNTINIHDTTEPVNRYKNTFTRKPGAAQLENIVEDSESYLSSSQQQSSNFNASSFVKESSKMYQHLSTDLIPEETHKEVYIGKDDKRIENAKKISNTSMNVDCSPIGSANCKALIEQTNDYVMIDGKKSYNKTNIKEHSLCDIHLPATDYCHNRNKEYSANVRQVKDVDDSMILSGGDIKILERPPPTPEPSIHVEMQEYTSDDESDKLRHTSKIGWTFYNNVLGQVNEILENSGVISDTNLNHAKTVCNVEQENDTETRMALGTVKAATLEQLRRLGISLTENNEHRESNGNKTYVSAY